jgi:2-methylcitrate dehydratase PrpD
LDALSEIVRRLQPRPQDVRSLVMRGGSKILVFGDYRPATYMAGQFSLPYLAAMVIMGVPTGYAWVTGERWKEPAVLALMDRVKLEADPDAEQMLAQGYNKASVRMELTDGRVEEAQATFARGSPRNPLSEQELRDKFLALAGPAVGKSAARELNRRLERLDEVESVAEIAAFLRRGSSAR